ncbi:MAG: hypothetical protein J6W29_02655, partial [Neisseriaceae bacterium]|nr:hypothetical protein [Neisseriaceae bacterium]
EKSQLKAAKDDLTVAKKELKAMRDELKNTRPHQVSYYLQWKEEKRQAISEKQSEVRERSHQYDELSFAFKTKTGEITDLEKEILTARLSGSLKERFDIAFRELRTQKKEIGAEYDALKLRIENKDFYEFEIQSVMQDAVGFYSGSRGMATLYHKGEPLPLTTDREKAIAYLLQVELPTQLYDELGKPFNALARKIKKLDTAERYIENANGDWGRYYGITQNDIDPYIDLLEDTENQLMKGSIEERAEINLTYDINTEYGKQKIRELFYNSRHDENQAELFEKVFAMAQKLNVEVRHALRDPHKTFSKRNATTTTLGWYQLNENSARVKHGGKIDTEEKGEVLLHELVHSVTSRAMLLKEQGHTELLNPAQVKAIDEIEKIYKIVLDKAEELGFEKHQKVTKDDKETFVGDYGLKNSHEFIAELANPVFREKLKQVAVFEDTVKAMTAVATGVEKTETAYDRLTAALYQIMDNYEPDFGARYEQAKYGNIKMNDITQTAEKGGIFMAEPILAEKTAKEMKEIINDLLRQRSEQMGNKHLSSDIATLMVYVQTDNPTAEETQAVKDLGVVKNFVENNMQYQKWYAPTPQDEIRRLQRKIDANFELQREYLAMGDEKGANAITVQIATLQEKQQSLGLQLPENTVKHDMNGLPEKPVHIDLDTPYIVAFPDEPNDPNANKTLGELMKQDDGVMWDAEFWGDRVGTGEMTVSENFITQVIATQRSEVLEEITTCGNVPFTKEHIEALYEREPELIQEVANDYNEPKIKALAKEVVETAEIGLKKQAFNNAFALFQVADKINALEKRLQKQPNMINGQTELKELKHEQGELEKEYDKLTNRAFNAGISLTKIRNGAKQQHAEFSGKPIQAAEVKQDALGLPENYQVRAADFDDFNPNLDGKTITANTLYSDIYTDIKPEQQGKTVGEVLRSDENALWNAEFWGELVGHGTIKVSDDLVAEVIATQRSEVLEEILTCGNVPFTKEHIEALYQREPELIQEVADDYAVPEIKALAKEVLQTAEMGLKKQAKQSSQASTKDDELLKQLCKPDFALRKAALNDPEISVNLLK